MTNDITIHAYGELIEPTTLFIQRLLPGPIDRVWAFLTDSDLRRRWLASGDMGQTSGASFTLTWRNDQLTDPPGQRPEGFGEEHSMESRIITWDPPHRLAFTWGDGDVLFVLEEKGANVLLSLTHQRITERASRLMIGAGWHIHLDLLLAVIAGKRPDKPFWDGWRLLREEYDQRLSI